MKNIVNIINFVRAIDPRDNTVDLLGTIRKELMLCREYGFKSTVLLQYDALIDSRFTDLCKEYGDILDIGIWLEIVEPLVKDAGLEWKGRWSWDWHNNVGFSIGYFPEERKKIIDIFFYRFKDIFGCFPAAAASWHIDALTLEYMWEKYDIAASCNCKDQYGTDGYTMWGGYYNGAYYPSKTNMLCPAQTRENQIGVPVFRMLGSDPIHQYDLGMGKAGSYDPSGCQGVISLEPVYSPGGGSGDWVNWYFRENFNGKNLSFSYTQVGQENSFGWEAINKGLKIQFEIMKNLANEGRIEILTLKESGEWFKREYEETPAAVMCIESDFSDEDYKTVWYYNKYYRTNLLYQKGCLWIRDIYLFDENFREKYVDRREESKDCAYFNLPVMDGFRYSRGKIRAGIYPYASGRQIINSTGEFKAEETGKDSMSVSVGDDLRYLIEEKQIVISSSISDWGLLFEYDSENVTYKEFKEKELLMEFAGNTGVDCKYSIRLVKGSFAVKNGKVNIIPENGEICMAMA